MQALYAVAWVRLRFAGLVVIAKPSCCRHCCDLVRVGATGSLPPVPPPPPPPVTPPTTPPSVPPTSVGLSPVEVLPLGRVPVEPELVLVEELERLSAARSRALRCLA